jgi:hypothetical protein
VGGVDLDAFLLGVCLLRCLLPGSDFFIIFRCWSRTRDPFSDHSGFGPGCGSFLGAVRARDSVKAGIHFFGFSLAEQEACLIFCRSRFL